MPVSLGHVSLQLMSRCPIESLCWSLPDAFHASYARVRSVSHYAVDIYIVIHSSPSLIRNPSLRFHFHQDIRISRLGILGSLLQLRSRHGG